MLVRRRQSVVKLKTPEKRQNKTRKNNKKIIIRIIKREDKSHRMSD
jgi:hypothetical protein